MNIYFEHILSRIIGPSNKNYGAYFRHWSHSLKIYCKPWNFDQFSCVFMQSSCMFMQNSYILMQSLCVFMQSSCMCMQNSCMNTDEIPSYILWNMGYQSTSPSIVKTDNFGWLRGNKRFCSTVCTAFTIKMVLAIIAIIIAIIDCSN